MSVFPKRPLNIRNVDIIQEEKPINICPKEIMCNEGCEIDSCDDPILPIKPKLNKCCDAYPCLCKCKSYFDKCCYPCPDDCETINCDDLCDKTFIIDHPIDCEKYLVHACLEGPEAGVYYRGKDMIAEDNDHIIINLPDYVPAIADNFTITLTPIYNGHKKKPLETSEFSDGCFTVYGNSGTKFFWTLFGKRKSINTEPLKKSVIINGDGPYRYIKN